MSLKNMQLAFLGAGNMAEALIKGIISKKQLSSNQISAFDVSKERLDKIKTELKINISKSNLLAVKEADVVVLSVKPQNLNEVLSEVGELLGKNKLVISIAAGMKIAKIEAMAKKELRVIRVMPNLPAFVQAGISALFPSRKASKEDIEIAKKIFSSVGEILFVEKEEDLDAVTALSGSGPGYLFYFAEALIEAGIKSGLSDEKVRKLVSYTLMGSSKMLIQSDDSAETLRKKVTSKGGTTEAALGVLDKYKFKESVTKAILEAVKRAKELSQ